MGGLSALGMISDWGGAYVWDFREHGGISTAMDLSGVCVPCNLDSTVHVLQGSL